MPKLPLEPHSSPETEIYRYFYNKLYDTTDPDNPVSRLKVGTKTINFLFSSSDTTDYPRVYLEYIRRKFTPSRYRHVGDDVVVLNNTTGLFERVSIGEPHEAFWGLSIESKSRDENYMIAQQIRVLLGRVGCVREPVYVEHGRETMYDLTEDNSLYKEESDSLIFKERIGYRTYMRLSGGYVDPTYEPRPPIEEIGVDANVNDIPSVDQNNTVTGGN
jgi:hypothetical protein